MPKLNRQIYYLITIKSLNPCVTYNIILIYQYLPIGYSPIGTFYVASISIRVIYVVLEIKFRKQLRTIMAFYAFCEQKLKFVRLSII